MVKHDISNSNHSIKFALNDDTIKCSNIDSIYVYKDDSFSKKHNKNDSFQQNAFLFERLLDKQPNVKLDRKSKKNDTKVDDDPPKRKLNTLALLSFIFGIIGGFTTFILFGLVFSIAAIILGKIAIKQIDESNHRYRGRSLAVSGIYYAKIGIIAAIIFWGLVLFAVFGMAR